MYRRFADVAKIPILANMTEFGMTPLATTKQLADAGVSVVLYPLSAFRAMNKAAEKVYDSIRKNGTQTEVVGMMQTRSELYDSIHYDQYEQQLDRQLNIKN
jgi:methylisocitrate lyase